MVPYHVGEQKLELLTGEARVDFLKQLRELSALTTDQERLEQIWAAFADRWLMTYGMPEIAESLALLSGTSAMLKALCLSWSRDLEGKGVLKYMGRRGIWKAAGWLDKRTRSAQRDEFAQGVPKARYGAAILRNRFDTASHRELYLLALRRVMEGQVGHAPEWAYAAVDELYGFPK